MIRTLLRHPIASIRMWLDVYRAEQKRAKP